jgi:two-component system, OmpR family, sensor kinase
VFDSLIDRVRGTGLRARLAFTISAIVVVAAGATFATVYRGTGSRVRDQIERDLSTEAGALTGRLAERGPAGPGITLARARRSIASEPAFGPSSRLVVVDVPPTGIATNEPELLGLGGAGRSEESAPDRHREADEGRAIRDAPLGLSTVHLEDAGDVALLKRALSGGRQPATITVGQPLAPVDRAQEGLAKTFLIAGSLTVAAALLAAFFAAAWIASPLRRMARAAGAVDAGDLTHRVPQGGAREVQQLAESFNHMLDRLEDAFARQRGFVSDASHELRTPLTVIRGQIEILGRSRAPSPEEIEGTAGRVNREIARMDRLVDDLTLLAQSDEGMTYHKGWIDLEPFIAETVEGASGPGARVEIGSVSPGRLPGDGDRLAQVVRNLVQNALEHTGPGGLVRVSANRRGDRIRISVEDDGPGIPAGERELIFDRFHRTDFSRARREGGSGLGLAIARAIVMAHQGLIWADASPEGGARIVFELPRFEPR